MTRLETLAVGAVIACALAVTACRNVAPSDTPTAPALDPSVMDGLQPAAASVAVQTTNGLPEWIVLPDVLPSGLQGRNNCTFSFGPDVPQWDFHPEAACWQRPGPDGWFRQQLQQIHIPSFPACGGGPGDATAVRVCRAGGRGQPSPCLIDPVTGPNGCARCVINPTCH